MLMYASFASYLMQLLASVLPCTGESNLLGCLKSVPSLEQLRFYARLVNEREERDKMAENNKTMLVSCDCCRSVNLVSS